MLPHQTRQPQRIAHRSDGVEQHVVEQPCRTGATSVPHGRTAQPCRVVPINEQNNLLVAGHLQQLNQHAQYRVSLIVTGHATRNPLDVAHLFWGQIRSLQKRQQASALTRKSVTHDAVDVGTAPRGARKVQRYHRIASKLIPIAPATRIPNLGTSKQAPYDLPDCGSLQKSLKHRQVHALAKAFGPATRHNGSISIQDIGNKHRLVD